MASATPDLRWLHNIVFNELRPMSALFQAIVKDSFMIQGRSHRSGPLFGQSEIFFFSKVKIVTLDYKVRVLASLLSLEHCISFTNRTPQILRP